MQDLLNYFAEYQFDFWLNGEAQINYLKHHLKHLYYC